MVTLEPMKEEDKSEFKQKIQEAFGIAVAENFGPTEPIPFDKELEEDFAAPDNVSLVILNDGKKVGGAIVKINPETQRNSLELFFIYSGVHGKGLGLAAWKAIEAKFPETKIWETVTPYFEKRNINFYVNKCGFHIVEYVNKHHRSRDERFNREMEHDVPGAKDFFRFEKVMTK